MHVLPRVAPGACQPALQGAYVGCPELGGEDISRIERVLAALPLLADVCRADQLVYARGAGGAVTIYHAAPHPVPSLYPQPQGGMRLDGRHRSPVYRVLYEGKEEQSVSGVLMRGAPTYQQVSPIRGADGVVIAALSSNSNLLEHERYQRQAPIFRSAVARIRERALDGELRRAVELGRLTEHDGVMIVDRHGIIRYVNSVAEHQYRRVGYVDSLLGRQISQLDTNEIICYRSIERGECLEHRTTEQDQVWIKRVIPVFPARVRRWRHRAPALDEGPESALVFIQDITEEVRREQELKIKSAMIQEVHHRVKNNLQAVAHLLRMEARRTSSPEARETLQQTIGRVLSIAVVHEFLSRGDSSDINIHEICQRIAAGVTEGDLVPGRRIQVRLEGEPFALPAQQATSCALAMNELLQNAVEHGFAGRAAGSIAISFAATEASMLIDISDDGRGLPPGFDLRTSPSLGLQITQALVGGDLRGHLELIDNNGVTARISFPKELCRPPA